MHKTMTQISPKKLTQSFKQVTQTNVTTKKCAWNTNEMGQMTLDNDSKKWPNKVIQGSDQESELVCNIS